MVEVVALVEPTCTNLAQSSVDVNMRFRSKPKMPPSTTRRVAQQQQPRSASPLPQQQHEQERQPKEPRITPDEFLEAAKNGNLRKVMVCIDKGIDVEVKASGGYTALHFSTYYGHLDIVKYLIETCNVDKEAKTDEGYTSSKGNDGYTALHIASSIGNLVIVEYLIETHHVDIEAATNGGSTALHLASSNGNLMVVKYLIETCHVDIEAKTIYGSTALHLAGLYGLLEIVQYLIETCQVDEEAKTYDGQTAYDLALTNDKINILEYLKERRTKSTVEMVESMPSEDKEKRIEEFLDAAKQGNLDKVKSHVNNGIDREAKSNRGYTSLHLASDNGHLEIVKYLVEICCADSEAKSNGGWTALHFASYSGHLEIVRYLVEVCHVDKEEKTNGGQKAYDVALRNKKNSIFEYLLEARNKVSALNDNEKELNLENRKEVPFQEPTYPASSPLSSRKHTSLPNSGAVSLPTDVLTNTFNLNSQSSFAYELNDGGMTKLQDDNQNLLDMLTQFGSSVQFIEERRDIVDMIVVEKCITIKEQAEQVAILSSPNHRDFYLLFQRKLKCMIKSCESLSTGMVGVKNGDMRSFASRTIHETGCNVLKETKLGFLVGSAVEWSKKNIAAIPFVDTIGSLFQLIVTMKFEHDRYLGLARVADFATMVCSPRYGTTSLDGTVEKLARLIVRSRCTLTHCKFVEKEDEFGNIKQLMINLLADSGNTPAKEQASVAADCAFAHILKPSQDSVLFGVLNDSVLDVGLDEALAVSVLGITLENLKKLDPFLLPLGTEILSTNVTPISSSCVSASDSLIKNESVSTYSSLLSANYVSSETGVEQEGIGQEEGDKVHEHDEKIQRLSRQVANLEKTVKESSRVNYNAGGGLVFANPTEQFENEIVGLQTDNVQLDKRLRDQATEIDDLKSRLVMLERQLSLTTK